MRDLSSGQTNRQTNRHTNILAKMQILESNDHKRVSRIMCLAQEQKLIYSD